MITTEFLGIFLSIAGFIIGLGAVTVIDIHGFLGIKSSYWTEATIRTHKVTRILIWVGTFLALFGGYLLYYNNLTQLTQIQFIIAIILILNGLFLTFYVSPYLIQKEKLGKAKELLPNSLQIKIAISFVISFLGWWSEVLLFSWYLFQK